MYGVLLCDVDSDSRSIILRYSIKNRRIMINKFVVKNYQKFVQRKERFISDNVNNQYYFHTVCSSSSSPCSD